jgi:hypothetical protein
VQAQLAGNTAERNAGTRTRRPSLLAGMLFDRDGNRMTPSQCRARNRKQRTALWHCAWSGIGITKDLRRLHPPSIESNVMRAQPISNPPPQSPSCPECSDMDAQYVGIFTKPRCSQG